MSLRIKLLFLSIVLALIPLGLAGRSMILKTRDELKSSAQDELVAVAREITQIIEDSYKGTWLTPLQVIKRAMENQNLGVNEKLSLLFAGMENVTDLVALQVSFEGVASPILVAQIEFSNQLENSSLAAEQVLELPPDRIAGLLKQGEIFAGDLTYVPEVDAWLITVILPFDESTFGRSAQLSARINLARIRERIENHPFTRRGFITLIDSQGRRIFDRERTDLSDRELVKTAMRLLASESGKVGLELYERPSGDEMLGAYSIPNITLGFGVIVEQNKADAYMPVTQMMWNLITWIIIGLSIAVIGAIIISVSLTRPLQKLTRAARRISEGDLSVSIEGKGSNDEIGELSKAFNKMSIDLRQYIDKLTEATKAKERAESELKLARDIQQNFLPKKFPEWEKIDVGGKCESARQVGGDYFDFFQIDRDNYGMAIGDVSGKGVPAALFMAVGRTLLRILASQEPSPDRVLTEFNNRLVALDQGSNMFITVFYGVFNSKTRLLRYSTAGHNMPYVKATRGRGGKFKMLPSMKTMVAGIMDGIEMPLSEAYLRRRGDTIILYTDGMIEAVNENDEEFGEERLEKLFAKYVDFSAQDMCETLIEEVKEFQGSRPQFDDMTMLVLKVKW